jgi:hypothetical protein
VSKDGYCINKKLIIDHFGIYWKSGDILEVSTDDYLDALNQIAENE